MTIQGRNGTNPLLKNIVKSIRHAAHGHDDLRDDEVKARHELIAQEVNSAYIIGRDEAWTAVEALLTKWTASGGSGIKSERVLGRQMISVEFVNDEIRKAMNLKAHADER